jgi:hypothetical protein
VNTATLRPSNSVSCTRHASDAASISLVDSSFETNSHGNSVKDKTVLIDSNSNNNHHNIACARSQFNVDQNHAADSLSLLAVSLKTVERFNKLVANCDERDKLIKSTQYGRFPLPAFRVVG